jgi:hypothetical protein
VKLGFVISIKECVRQKKKLFSIFLFYFQIKFVFRMKFCNQFGAWPGHVINYLEEKRLEFVVIEKKMKTAIKLCDLKKTEFWKKYVP